jgi:hypothetical protein
LKLFSTAAAGALDVWVGIITGVALGLSPALSGALSIESAVVGVTLVVVAGKRLQRLIYRSRHLAKHRERVERVWKRYGIAGLALQAPLLTGPLLATLLALTLGALPVPSCYGCSPAWCSGARYSPEVPPWASRYSGPSGLRRIHLLDTSVNKRGLGI